MERSGWSRHILELWTTRCTQQCYREFQIWAYIMGSKVIVARFNHRLTRGEMDWKRTMQSLSQRSKTRTNVADPGSTSGGTFQCMQFLPFFIYFSYLFYLGHLSLLGLQTKTRRQSNSSTFSSFKSHNPETFMSSAAIAFVHAVCKRSQKCLA